MPSACIAGTDDVKIAIPDLPAHSRPFLRQMPPVLLRHVLDVEFQILAGFDVYAAKIAAPEDLKKLFTLVEDAGVCGVGG